VTQALQKAAIAYTRDDRFEIALRLYLPESKLQLVDIDNRLKDVLDALQGHVGGAGKKQRMLRPLIHNDSQIFRVIAEKSAPPRQSRHGRGHLVIRKYKGPNYR
jgi:Holliday junction resolvase RusA-like endonuclease